MASAEGGPGETSDLAARADFPLQWDRLAPPASALTPEDFILPPRQRPPGAQPASYWLTRFILLRWLGAIYAVAFLVAANQIVPLVGQDGLLPAGAMLDKAILQNGSTWDGFFQSPSIFWWGHSDGAFVAWAWIGFLLSCVVVAGYANALLMAALWFLYLSFLPVGQDWYGYGWEIQLLETGFLGIFLCPLLDGRPFPRRAPPVVILWLFRWLIFRIMFGAGMIKLRGDASWRDLTALYYHFETQPIPNPLSRWFFFLPKWILRVGVLCNHEAELVLPWFVFWPGLSRQIAGGLIILFQFTLILSGNLSFLNWLTIVPALACLDDSFWRLILPHSLTRRAERAADEAQPSEPMLRVTWAVAAVVLYLSVPVVRNLTSSHQMMNTSFDPLHLVNTYGAFGTVGKERMNVVFEGTNADIPSEADWKPYPYKGLPVNLDKSPAQIAPYQLRLDWQMWFAAMSDYQHYPWTLNLVWKLLHNDPGTLSLFADNPFPEKPPRFVRAVLYKYAFAMPGNPEGHYWNRQMVGLWLPPLSADNAELRALLEKVGWVQEKTPAPASVAK